MAKSAIYTVNNTAAEVKDGDIIPLGTIIRRFGQNIRQDGNAITICDLCRDRKCSGYYNVDIVANIETAAATGYKVVLQKDGVEVIGGVAEISPAPAGNILPFPISVIVKNSCGGTAALSVKLIGGDAKIISMATNVVRL